MPKLPKFEEWQAPWEKNKTDFNAETAKKLIYDKTLDLEKANDAHAEKVTSLTTENAELTTKVTEFTKAGETAAEKTAREAAEAAKKAQEQAVADATKTTDLKIARLEVAVEKGLTADDMKRIVGSTKEELLTDADVFIAEYRGSTEAKEEPNAARRTPARPRNPLLPEGGAGDITTEDILKAVPRN